MLKRSLTVFAAALVSLLVTASIASASDFSKKDQYGCFVQPNKTTICVDPPISTTTTSSRCLKFVPKADLHSCNLAGVNLSPKWVAPKGQHSGYYDYTNLTGANLKNAVLTNANLRGVVLTSADLTGADLSGATLNPIDVPAAPPYGATTAKTNLTNADLSGTNLTSVDLRFVVISGIQSGGITGSGLKLPSGNSDTCVGNISPITSTGTRCTHFEPENWSLINGYIVGPRANLSGALLNDADLSHADLNNNVNFTKAHLTRAKFSGADVQGANFTGATLNNADLSSTWLTQATFKDASMKSVNLSGARGCSTTYNSITYEGSGYNVPAPVVVSSMNNDPADCIKGWSRCGWEDGQRWGSPVPAWWQCGSSFQKADLTGANLSNVFLPQGIFTSANLTRATVTGSAWNASFYKANLTDATFGVSMYYGTLYGAKTTRTKMTSSTLICTTLVDGKQAPVPWYLSSQTCPLHS